MSTILWKMAKNQVEKPIKSREKSRQFLSRQSGKTSVQLEFKPKTPISQSTSLQFFRDRLKDGHYSISQTPSRKSLLEDVFKRMNPMLKRDLIEVMLQQFESEFFILCNEKGYLDLQEKYMSYQSMMSKLLKHVLHFVDDRLKDISDLEGKIRDLELQLSQAEVQYQGLQSQYVQLGGVSTKDIKTKLSKTEQAKRQSELYMENLRLRNEIERIQEKLKTIEVQTDVQHLLQKIDQMKKDYNEKLMELLNENQIKEKQLSKLNLHYQNIKAQYNKLENETKAYQTVFEANKQQLDRILLDNEHNLALMNKNREIALMQREDYEMRIFFLREELGIAKKAQEKLQQLQSKLDRFQIEKSKEIEPQPNAHYEKEKSAFERFNNLFSNDKTFFRLTQQDLANDRARIVTRIGHSVPIMENYFNSQEVQLERFTIGYNPFAVYVEHHKKTLENEYMSLQYKKPSLHLLVTCRHILDALHNSFQMGKYYSFSEFTYSWLMNFKIDLQQKCCTRLPLDPHRADDQIIKFIIDLANPQLERNWECITIQEFINDFTSTDELFFYLFARNLLFRGSETLHKTAYFEANHYVPLVQAEFVATHILQQYEISTLQQVRKVLKEKAIKKISSKPIYIIDAAFVMRILLEFYRVERRNRYKMFKQAFGSRASNIGFKQFRIVMISNYPDMSDLEMARLYRLSYSFNGAGVSVDSFYTMASDTGFFIKHLKLHNMLQTPKIVNEEIAFEPINQQFVLIIESYRRLQKLGGIWEDLLLELGQEEFYVKMKQLDLIIENKLAHINLSPLSFLSQLRVYTDMFRHIGNIVYSRLLLRDTNPYGVDYQAQHEERSKQQQNKELIVGTDNFNRSYERKEDYISDLEIVKNDLESIDHIMAFLRTREHQRKQLYLSKSISSKKIQKFMRKKMNKFYSFVSSLLSAKLKANMKTAK